MNFRRTLLILAACIRIKHGLGHSATAQSVVAACVAEGTIAAVFSGLAQAPQSS